jgi:hypothetical protein
MTSIFGKLFSSMLGPKVNEKKPATDPLVKNENLNLPKHDADTLEPAVKKQPEPRKSILSIFGLGDISPARKPVETTSSSTYESTNNSSQSVGAKAKP